MLGDEFAEFIDSNLDEEIDAGPPAQQQWPAGAPLIPQGAVAAAADPPPFGQLEHAAHPVPPLVFNDEDAAEVRDQPAEGEDNEDWTPKGLTGNTGILSSFFLRHHRCVMLLPRKISADKDETSTNDKGQSKKGSWSNTTKLQTDVIAPLRAKPETRIVRTSWTTPASQPRGDDGLRLVRENPSWPGRSIQANFLHLQPRR
jgi:hypothetical protein